MSNAPWLLTAQSLIGTREAPGAADNPTILQWSSAIAVLYPDLKKYTQEYAHDSIPWCGDFVAYVLATNGIKPVTKADGASYGFLWAHDWIYFGVPCKPQPGAIMVFDGHVCFYKDEDATHYTVVGGNQSDAVTTTRISKGNFIAARWPKTVAAPATTAPPVAQPEINDWHAPVIDALPEDHDDVPAPVDDHWTMTKVGGAILSSGGAAVLGFINSPYALGALVILCVFGYFLFREWQTKKAK